MSDLDEQLLCACATGDVPSCLDLLACGADVNATDEFGWTPLHKAVLYRNTPVCLMLLNHGSDPWITNNKNQTALDVAIKFQKEDCIGVMRAWLLAHCARAALQEINAGSAI